MAEGAKVTLILGKRDSGKTVYLRGDDSLQVEGFFNMYLDAGIKILIVDTRDHEKYRDIPFLTLQQLPYWKQGVYRIIIDADEPFEFYELIFSKENTNLDNTFMVFEDAYKHCQGKVNRTFKNFLLDAKNRNIEVAFMYHAWGWVPNDLYKLINLIQVFKTLDSPKSKKDEMPGYYEVADEIYQKVKSHPVSWYNLLIDTGL